MTVICNILDCGYNTDGICCQKCYLTIQNGQCKWLINNPNYRVRGPMQDAFACEPNCEPVVTQAVEPVNTTESTVQKPKRKYTKKKKKG